MKRLLFLWEEPSELRYTWGHEVVSRYKEEQEQKSSQKWARAIQEGQESEQEAMKLKS